MTPADPLSDRNAEEAALARALRMLADNREGAMSFEEHVVPVKFIRSPIEGHLLASVPVAMLLADEVIIFVPDEREDALQLLVSAEEVGESPLTDRYTAYFQEPDHVRWAELWIDAGRLNEYVFDGDALMVSNPLAGDETALIRALNEDPSALKRACAARCTREIEAPLAVGVDALGIDIRAAFGIVRLPFDERADDAETARAQIESMLKGDA